MSRIIPFVIAVVVIAALTVVEGRVTERWGDSRHGAYCASLMADIPRTIGEWAGEDNEITTEETEGAGARGYVSRTYKNADAGKAVGIWFIVGHARDTFRHTPDICYGAQDYVIQDNGQQRYDLELGDGKAASFWTALFTRENEFGNEEKRRVFWTWFRPRADSGEPVTWSVPEGLSKAAIRTKFSAAPALYKLYFSTYGPDAEPGDGTSVCMEFAKKFLTEVEPVLAPANGPIPDGFDPSSVQVDVAAAPDAA